MNTIGDMQNEKDYAHHYNEFRYNHDFVNFLWKIDDVLEMYLVWDDNVCLYSIDYLEVLLFGVNNFLLIKIVTMFNNAFVSNWNIITFQFFIFFI